MVDYVIGQCSSEAKAPPDIIRYPESPPSKDSLFYPFSSFCLFRIPSSRIGAGSKTKADVTSPYNGAFANIYNYGSFWETSALSDNRQKILFIGRMLGKNPLLIDRYLEFIDTLFRNLPPDDVVKMPLTSFPNFSHKPVAMRAAIAGLREFMGRKVLLVHFPSEITFSVPKTSQNISFSYGFLPHAYENGHAMKPIKIRVSKINGGNETTLLEKVLDPVQDVEERGIMNENILLQGCDSVKIEFVAGPLSDGSYAATWISDVQIHSPLR